MNKEIVSTSDAPSAIGPYSQAVKTGLVVFTSGQIGLDPATGELAQDFESAGAAGIQESGRGGQSERRIARECGEVHAVLDRPRAIRHGQRDHGRDGAQALSGTFDGRCRELAAWRAVRGRSDPGSLTLASKPRVDEATAAASNTHRGAACARGIDFRLGFCIALAAALRRRNAYYADCRIDRG